MRSVKLNKFNLSSQLDGRRNLINLSILGLDYWTEPHCGVSVQWQRGGEGHRCVFVRQKESDRERGRDRNIKASEEVDSTQNRHTQMLAHAYTFAKSLHPRHSPTKGKCGDGRWKQRERN